jgi:NADH-quinone oxidoreductase subunit B
MNFTTTTFSRAQQWAQSKSFWYFSIRSGCCADEVLDAKGCRYDLERFGCIERTEPNQADLLIISGLITEKMAPFVLDIYSKMLTPKYVLAIGACACSGGLFSKKGLDEFIPVDVHVPGCPPRPEAIMHGLITLQEKVSGKKRN